MLYWLEESAKLRPDFVCFPEIALHSGLTPAEGLIKAQTIPGPSTSKVAEYAKKLNTYIIWTLIEQDNNRFYNTAVLISRTGRIIGRYRKFQPTSYEMADGISPGTEVPVWQTDFGRVGAATCFDIKFPEIGLALSRGKANIVFWPSMFVGGLRLNSWSRDYGFHMVACYTGGCTIVASSGRDVFGKEQAQPFPPGQGLLASAFAELNTDCKTYHLDYNQHKLSAIKDKYGEGVDICYCRDEATFVLSSKMDDYSIGDIEQEFELEDLRDYLDKAMADRQDRLRALED
jgi:predicted amidohydrolase